MNTNHLKLYNLLLDSKIFCPNRSIAKFEQIVKSHTICGYLDLKQIPMDNHGIS
jgi:hypothetical protein